MADFVTSERISLLQEKSVPPDMKLSGGPIQETNIASPETHPKFNDAVNFLDKVEGRFKKEPDIYRTFLNTLTEYRAKRINKPDLARKVAILFEGHPDLVTEFNEFIKSKKKTDQEAAENQYTVIDTEVGISRTFQKVTSFQSKL